MKSKTNLNCKECGKPFEIPTKEYNRQIRNGREPDHFFCGLSCSKTHSNRGNDYWKNIENWGKHPRTKDKYSPFRYYVRKAKQRPKDCNITVEYLYELWHKQEGKCAFTGMPLVLYDDKVHDYITQASLDRIDSNKGYVKGNVQFVSTCLNFAKSNMSDEQFRRGLAEMFSHFTTSSGLLLIK